jgi:hypothetical protein
MVGGYGVSGLLIGLRLVIGRVCSGGPHGVLRIRLQFVECLWLV